MKSPSPSDEPPPREYVPWTPPEAPPSTRISDAIRPLAMIGVGAVVVALLVVWMVGQDPEPTDVSPVRAGGGVVQGAPASLLVDSEPIGVTVWVNGDSVGVTPAWLPEVASGVVEVVLGSRQSGHDTTLALRPGQDASVLIWLQSDLAREPERLSQNIEARPEGEAAAPTISSATVDVTEPPSGEAPRVEREERETGRLQLTSVPEGASVWLARERVGQTPLSLDALPAGEHIVEVRAAGYEPERLRLNIAPDALTTQAITLRARPGIVTIMADAGSRVFVDGDLQGTVENQPLRLPLAAGRYEVRVFHPSKGEQYQVAEVVAGTALRLTFDQATASATSEDPPARGSEPPRRRTGW
ncbi:MAG: PEGA domain-containing protein [Bacteroidota bacterium]